MKPETKLAIGSSFLLLFFWVSCSSNRDVKEAPITNVRVMEEQRIKTQDVITENEVYFEFDSSEIKSAYSRVLDEKARILLDDRSLQIYLTGHTDIVGSREYNNKLGFNRARAVKTELVDRGVYEKQIFVKSVGESKALVLTDKDDMQKDRRVDLEIRTPSRLSKK